ncbi:BQ5605_C026g10191 [Microbotryum silenes-dioicae]|uniref:BQ5605_C026g10191 protein n=3 Tax=Microbotryum TaxID=34416 RepID=A0A2X0NFK1_9BASI|nr:BQ5605_C026g10191 [Microbotryum silenes-dioicae]
MIRSNYARQTAGQESCACGGNLLEKGCDVDPTIAPRWVNDYRELNKHTIKDRTPLPLPDDILSTCSNAQFWAKIDMTNSFFQTKMAEEDIHKTAVSTPWGLYEWTVMPMGLCNAPATHQRRVNEALQGLLGTICFVYLDDITIFADTLEEHEARVRQVLDALRRAKLYCSPTKTNLATAECLFLGHIINRAGVHADPKKIQHIEDWSLPKTVKELRGFLGLVQYLCKFIPGLAEHTAALTPLTRQGLSSIATLWIPNEVRHFKAIKAIVTSLDCLRPPDHSANAAPFWVMTDASNQGIGGVLLQGQEWKVARPIAYWSRQYIPAERNYPTHEQELLAIVEALKEWRIDLLGGHFHILTDHSTLEHFQTQRTVLSRRQARWLDTLAEFDYDLRYLPGEDNIIADAMSRYSFTNPLPTLVAGVSHVKLSDAVKQQILDAYETDPFCQQAMSNIGSVTSDFKIVDALLYLRGRLIIPSLAPLRESILHDAHDAQGHLGDMKTYQTVQQAYFWPNMSRDVKHYVQQCDSCQRTKACTTRIAGKLHSLPVPTRPMADIAINFVGPLPANKGFDRVLTITDRLSGYVRLLPARKADTAAEVAARFHEGWHRLFGLPQSIVSDRDKLFTSKFWTALHKRLNIKLQLSSVFHPETDGCSEKTNKTAFQILRALVNKEQSNWAECLAVCEYAINSSLNVATGETPFELVLGYTPSLAPLAHVDGDDDLPSVEELLALRFQACEDARDQLAISKVRQAAQSNKKRQDEPSWAVGDLVLLDSSDRRKRLHTRKRRAAKLMDRFDGPYCIVKAQPEILSYTLQLNGDDAAVPFFHTGKLKTYHKNNTALFPNHEPARLGPVDVGGEPEYIMEDIVDERIRAGKQQYLVSWLLWPSDSNSWEPAEALEDTEALDRWERWNEEESGGSGSAHSDASPRLTSVQVADKVAEYREQAIRRNNLACKYIANSISEEQMSHLIHLTSAYEMWDTLRGLHSHGRPSRTMDLLNTLAQPYSGDIPFKEFINKVKIAMADFQNLGAPLPHWLFAGMLVRSLPAHRTMDLLNTLAQPYSGDIPFKEFVNKVKIAMTDFQNLGAPLPHWLFAGMLVRSLPAQYDSIVGNLASDIDIHMDWNMFYPKLLMNVEMADSRNKQKESLSARIVDNTSLVARISTTAQKDYSKSDCSRCKALGHERGWRLCPSRNKDASAPASSDSNSNVAAIGVDESALMTYTFPYSRTMPRFPWIIDSGAKVHCVGDKSVLSDVVSEPLKISVADQSQIKSPGHGSVTFLTSYGARITIKRVYYMPGAQCGFISIDRLLESMTYAVGPQSNLIFSIRGKLILRSLPGRGFVMDAAPVQPIMSSSPPSMVGANRLTGTCTLMEAHLKLGHQSPAAIVLAVKSGAITGITLKDEKVTPCFSCIQAKSKRSPFSNKSTEAPHALYRVFIDLGFVEHPNRNGDTIYLAIVDQYSTAKWTIVLKDKRAETIIEAWSKFQAESERQTGQKIKRVRSDDGREFNNSLFRALLEKQGTIVEFTAPYTPEQNGQVERLNGSLMGLVRSMLLDSGLPMRFWSDALAVATFVLNHRPHPRIQGKTAIEVLLGKKPSLAHLQPFGSTAFVHVPKERRSKLAPRSIQGVFIGYSGEYNYRVWVQSSKQVYVSHHVTFLETPSVVTLSQDCADASDPVHHSQPPHPPHPPPDVLPSTPTSPVVDPTLPDPQPPPVVPIGVGQQGGYLAVVPRKDDDNDDNNGPDNYHDAEEPLDGEAEVALAPREGYAIVCTGPNPGQFENVDPSNILPAGSHR